MEVDRKSLFRDAVGHWVLKGKVLFMMLELQSQLLVFLQGKESV